MVQRLVLGVLVLIGALLIIFHESVIQTVQDWLAGSDERVVVATLLNSKGKVRYKIPQSLKYNNVRSEMKFRDLDTLTTDADSTAQIAFEGGVELEVGPNSMIIVERPKADSTGAIQITFLRGDYKILNPGSGQAGQIVVSKDKKFQDVAGRKPLEPLKIKVDAPPPAPPVVEKTEKLEEKPQKPAFVQATPPPKKQPKKKQRETLPDEYIASVVNNQKPFFNRCYAQHLRLNPESRGQIFLAFTIDPAGKVSQVNLINSSMNDQSLDRCTMSVLERCRFRSFDGDPIIVNYPINFE